MKGMQNQHNKREKNYKNIAERNKLPVEEVVVDITSSEYKEAEEDETFKPVSEMTPDELDKFILGN